MNEEFRKMLSELVGEELEFDGFKEEFEKEGLPHDLKRIADALEDINGALIGMGGDIEALGDCVDTIPAWYTQGIDLHFLRIGGSVDSGI